MSTKDVYEIAVKDLAFRPITSPHGELTLARNQFTRYAQISTLIGGRRG